MPVTYQTADEETAKFIVHVMERHHPHLHAAKVRITTVFAFAPVDAEGKRTGPALKHAGYAAAATIKPTTLHRRCQGLGDAELNIDGDNWSTWPKAKRVALIDHELSHLVLKQNDSGGPQLDLLGRPKLTSRLHDWHFGGFVHILERHGEDSFEADHILADENGQYLFAWATDHARKRDSPPPRKRKAG